MITHIRARLSYVAVVTATIALGLWVHRGGVTLSVDARDVAGDAIWAMMMTWCVAAAAPAVRLPARGGLAFGICAAVETSQLIHTPPLDAVRATTLGSLVLGSGFDPRDFAAYALGVTVATLLEWTTRRAGRALRQRVDSD